MEQEDFVVEAAIKGKQQRKVSQWDKQLRRDLTSASKIGDNFMYFGGGANTFI